MNMEKDYTSKISNNYKIVSDEEQSKFEKVIEFITIIQCKCCTLPLFIFPAASTCYRLGLEQAMFQRATTSRMSHCDIEDRRSCSTQTYT